MVQRRRKPGILPAGPIRHMTWTMPQRLDPAEVLARVRSVLPIESGPFALHEPRFAEPERSYVIDCLDSGWVSYAGNYVSRFEAAIGEACGGTHAVAVSSGTVALQLALELAGLQRNEEVLVPALTFVATANAVVHAGGIPHFVDVNETTMGIDPGALRRYLGKAARMEASICVNRATGRRIRALMPVHVFGHPADMLGLLDVAAEFGFDVIEDATEALGSFYCDLPCGSLAPLGALSFNGNKIVTTGGGGAILCRDETIARRARQLTTTAKRPHRWEFVHDEVAYNFRLPNLNAALGIGQLERLTAIVDAKRRLQAGYASAFSGMPGISVFQDAPFARSNFWLTCILLAEPDRALRDRLLWILNDNGIMARPVWTPMHLLPMYVRNPRADLPVTESLADRVINLPSSPFLAPGAR